MQTINPQTPLLTRAEVAAALAVTRNYLDHCSARGEGPPYVRIGRTVRYDGQAVARWLADQARTPRAA